MKYTIIAFLIAATGFCAPEPTPTPTPTPAPTITLSNGVKLTAAQIEQEFKDLNERIAELTNERNTFAGQTLDLQYQMQHPKAK